MILIIMVKKEKILFLAKSIWNHVIFCLIPQSIFICSYTFFRNSYNTLAGLCISSTAHAFTLRSLVIASYTLCFSNNNHNINAHMSQHASSLAWSVIQCVTYHQIKASYATGWLFSFSGTFSIILHGSIIE